MLTLGDADPPMVCSVCSEKIPEGAGHYRLMDARVHVACLKWFCSRGRRVAAATA